MPKARPLLRRLRTAAMVAVAAAVALRTQRACRTHKPAWAGGRAASPGSGVSTARQCLARPQRVCPSTAAAQRQAGDSPGWTPAATPAMPAQNRLFAHPCAKSALKSDDLQGAARPAACGQRKPTAGSSPGWRMDHKRQTARQARQCDAGPGGQTARLRMACNAAFARWPMPPCNRGACKHVLRAAAGRDWHRAKPAQPPVAGLALGW